MNDICAFIRLKLELLYHNSARTVSIRFWIKICKIKKSY